MSGDFDLDAWRRTNKQDKAMKKSKGSKKPGKAEDASFKQKKVSKRPAGHDDSDTDNEESGESEHEFNEDVQHQSAKASFMAKVLSPLMGYGTDWCLQHFVYDLWLWSSIGGAKNAAGIPMRGALSGR
eukprot:4309755-Karenia_brevis.AAC.1